MKTFNQRFQEAEQDNYSMPKNILGILFIVFTLMLMFGCTKEVSKPIELRPPARSFSTVDITVKFFQTTHPLAQGDLYGLHIQSSHIMRVTTQFWMEWKDGNTTWQLRPFIFGGESAMDWHTMIPIVKGATDLRLTRVDGDSTIVYRLKQIL